MKAPRILSLGVRAIRHLFTERDYERYYSSSVWEGKYQEGYDLGKEAEDVRYGALMAILRRYDRGGAILDCGCGDGLLEQRIRPLTASRLAGLDYAATAIEAACKRGVPNCEFVCTDFRAYSPEERYGIILFNEALYYVQDFLGVLDKFAKLLDEDGVLVISMFDTRVTARIWKAVRQRYRQVQGVAIRDEATGLAWHVRVLRPPAGTGA
jgi:trans-aconitate methyltransferase